MELWEMLARESIRDLVTRYNSNGDTGRFEHTMELFAEDAVMTIPGGEYRGKDEILTIFTGTRDQLSSKASSRAAPPAYVRHSTATHQIDLIDETRATGRCYFTVITPIGVDHWGRYRDEYKLVGDRWLFASRHVTVDGRAPSSTFPPSSEDSN